MNDSPANDGLRRVILGDTHDGRSAVLRDEQTAARIVRPTGAAVHEIWRQEQVPGGIDNRQGDGQVDLTLPTAGFSMRLFTIPPETIVVEDLARSDSVFVAIVIAGTAHLVLETEEVKLSRGDSFVLPGSKHAWRNPHAETAEVVTTVFRRD